MTDLRSYDGTMTPISELLADAMHAEDISELNAASYRNFHARGMDYLCVKRTPEHTVKLYILDGDCTASPEVVNPHDHRYRFETRVLAGALADHRWTRSERAWVGEMYEAYDYLTPLNGGDGFSWRGTEMLWRDGPASILRVGGTILSTRPEQIHTIQALSDQTLLVLEQFEDVVEQGVPTSTWSAGDPPSLDDGLYERFTDGEYRDRLRWALNRTPIAGLMA